MSKIRIGLEKDGKTTPIEITEGAAFVIAHILIETGRKAIDREYREMLEKFAREFLKAAPTLGGNKS